MASLLHVGEISKPWELHDLIPGLLSQLFLYLSTSRKINSLYSGFLEKQDSKSPPVQVMYI